MQKLRAGLVIQVFLSLFVSTFANAETVPSWFSRDVHRRAAWLPINIKTLGVEESYRRNWAAFPSDVQAVLQRMAIPSWQIALVPYSSSQQAEITKQFLMMINLAGAQPVSPIARRLEQLLIFAGAAQLPTPGDRRTGASLGAEGCTAAMSRYVIAQLKLEFPRELSQLPSALTDSQSSVEMKALFVRLAASAPNIVRVRRFSFSQLQAADIAAGSLMIAEKPGGTHTFGWTRVSRFWNWSPDDKMAVGNTGLAQFGDRMILAQEYVTANPEVAGELQHNQHGPINSTNVVYLRGAVNLSDPRTNVYAARGSDFILIDFY